MAYTSDKAGLTSAKYSKVDNIYIKLALMDNNFNAIKNSLKKSFKNIFLRPMFCIPVNNI